MPFVLTGVLLEQLEEESVWHNWQIWVHRENCHYNGDGDGIHHIAVFLECQI